MKNANYTGMAGTINDQPLTAWALARRGDGVVGELTATGRHPFATGDEVTVSLRHFAEGVGFLDVKAVVAPAEDGDPETLVRVSIAELPNPSM